MTTTNLTFNKKPANAMAMLKALVLPRSGFDAAIGLPDLQAQWHGAMANSADLAGFFSTLDLKPTEYLPITYPHVMAGTMCMNLFAHKEFPIRLLGALHLKNRIVQHRPIRIDEAIDIDIKVGAYRLVEKGMEFDIVTDIKVQDELVWQETSIYFVRGKYGGQDNPSTEKSFELESLDAAAVLHEWHIPKDRGRKYASISGDYNPIHMSSLAAKAFGFKRDIAHGFGVTAQAIEYSKALSNMELEGAVIQVDVVFKGPVFLGSDVSVRQNVDQEANRYDVYCGDNLRPNLCLAVKNLAL